MSTNPSLVREKKRPIKAPAGRHHNAIPQLWFWILMPSTCFAKWLLEAKAMALLFQGYYVRNGAGLTNAVASVSCWKN